MPLYSTFHETLYHRFGCVVPVARERNAMYRGQIKAVQPEWLHFTPHLLFHELAQES